MIAILPLVGHRPASGMCTVADGQGSARDSGYCGNSLIFQLFPLLKVLIHLHRLHGLIQDHLHNLIQGEVLQAA